MKQADRWQVNAALIEMAMNENRRIIDTNSSSYTQQPASVGTGDRKTKFQVMAEIQQTTALVQSAFNQAYRYQENEYYEVARRFFKDDSKDIEVREFQAACLRAGVPKKALCIEYWDIEPTQVMGAGNSTMQMAISEQLLNMRNLFDPEPQRDILREVTFNITGDAAKAEAWVPESATRVTDSTHDAQLACGALMQGLPVSLKTGMNHQEYVVTMVGNLTILVKRAEAEGGMATQKEIQGFSAIAQNTQQHLKILAQDKNQRQFVTEVEKEIANLMNMVRAFAQRLQEQQQQAQQQGAGIPPADAAKIQAIQMQAQVKADNAKSSHALKTAQKQVSFEEKQKQDQIAFELDQRRKNAEAMHEHARGQVQAESDNGIAAAEAAAAAVEGETK